MNIFKRISSFATTSWRDLTAAGSDDRKFLNQEDPESINHQQYEQDGVDVPDTFIRTRRVFSKALLPSRQRKMEEKIAKMLILDDPRSPTTDFSRTPIVRVENNPYVADVLSPFDVETMLEAVQSAIECHDNDTTTDSKKTEENPANTEELNEPKVEVSVPEPESPQDEIQKIDEICNWNEIVEFKEKTLSDSLIVECSNLTLKTVDDQEQQDSAEDSKNDKENCKVVGFTMKQASKKSSALKSSTPKKSGVVLETKQPRTPLMAIGNSPLMKNQQSKKLGNSLGNKVSGVRKPATPMNPFRNRQPVAVHQPMCQFGKENF